MMEERGREGLGGCTGGVPVSVSLSLAINMNIEDVSTPVVVLRGVESASHGALGVLRSLGRLGVPVYAVACHPRTAAFFSRYCAGKHVCDVANGDAERSLDFLLD